MQVKRLVLFLFLFLMSIPLIAQSVGLVLSGGGTRGLIHIGVIKALEENNIPIDYVSGTSIGAIIGGLYSIGLSPDEMVTLIKSEEFKSWQLGQSEKVYESHIYRRDDTPEFFGATFDFKNREFNFNSLLPTNLIAPYPMDIAFIQLLASSSAAASYDFDNLMVPFRCVASDIVRKRSHTFKDGGLEVAIRASMTFPFVFKPIVVDSVLMYDGGFYNNFPWDVMESEFKPDYTIGVNCTRNPPEPHVDDLIVQVENMVMTKTDYSIPSDMGIMIDGDYLDIGISDYTRIDDLVKRGYDSAMVKIPLILDAIKARRTLSEVEDMRLSFRKRCTQLMFDQIYFIPDTIKKGKKEYMVNILKNHSKEPVTFEMIKRGFNRVVASGFVNTFYPTAKMNSDSLFDLTLRVTEHSPFRVSIGGNISSSSLNQGYLGLEYKQFDRYPLRTNFDLDLGRFYTGGSLSFRQDFSVKPLLFYEVNLVAHRFDYFKSNQIDHYPDKPPTGIREMEIFGSIRVGSPIDINRSIIGKLNVNFGSNLYSYYLSDLFTSYDIPEKTNLTFVSPAITLERNSTNFKIFPTSGIKQKLSLSYSYISSNYEPGSTSETFLPVKNVISNRFKISFNSEIYYNINRWLTIGSLIDIALSNKVVLGDFVSSLLLMPAFQPTPHSKTLLLEEYRASSYIAAGVNPIFNLSSTVYLTTLISYFQPLNETFKKGTFLGNAAVAWQSPIGPVSISLSYYPHSNIKWYPQFNIGFLIFRNKSLNN